MGSGSRIYIPRGSFLFLGFAFFAPNPVSLQIGRDARLTIHGTVQFHRGVRVTVGDGAHLEIGTKTFINECSTVTCFERITIGAGCAISWNTNIMDANFHEVVIAGRPRPRSAPVAIGDRVWVGSGATILAGTTIGEQSVIAAASVVSADVPGGVVVGGNPARIIADNASWNH
jgi:acetyltransferase-like isoleucine patch superfamily enzyme